MTDDYMKLLPVKFSRTHDNRYFEQNYPTFLQYFLKVLELDELQLPLPKILYYNTLVKTENLFNSNVPWPFRITEKQYEKDLYKIPSYIKRHPNINYLPNPTHNLNLVIQTPCES